MAHQRTKDENTCLADLMAHAHANWSSRFGFLTSEKNRQRQRGHHFDAADPINQISLSECKFDPVWSFDVEKSDKGHGKAGDRQIDDTK